MTDARFELLGWPADGPTLRLDHREFAYAGKFVVSSTGKAVLRPTAPDGPAREDASDRAVLAAVAFDADRTDPDRLVLRYVTVRADRRGEGLGPRLVGGLLERARGRYERARIAVNNPYAYEALYRAGFAYTGERTGLAELVLERPVTEPAAVDADRYRAGLERFRFGDRELDEAQRSFVAERLRRGPPAEATETDAGDAAGGDR